MLGEKRLTVLRLERIELLLRARLDSAVVVSAMPEHREKQQAHHDAVHRKFKSARLALYIARLR